MKIFNSHKEIMDFAKMLYSKYNFAFSFTKVESQDNLDFKKMILRDFTSIEIDSEFIYLSTQKKLSFIKEVFSNKEEFQNYSYNPFPLYMDIRKLDKYISGWETALSKYSDKYEIEEFEEQINFDLRDRKSKNKKLDYLYRKRKELPESSNLYNKKLSFIKKEIDYFENINNINEKEDTTTALQTLMLYYLGVIETYNKKLTNVKLAVLLSHILNRNEQNIRTLLTNFNNPSKPPKNIKNLEKVKIIFEELNMYEIVEKINSDLKSLYNKNL